ncbi:MAG: hypothetical protein U9N04_01405 [Patescibacteria group bacterium]|nr:hypothetical protein [Patescibacteria group bacterium]
MEYFILPETSWQILQIMLDFYRSLFSEGMMLAVIILVVGAIFGFELGKVAGRLVKKLGVDKIFDLVGIKRFLKRGGIKFSITGLTEWIVKWFVILFSLMVAVDFLNLPRVSEFLSRILNYIPSLIGAIAVLTIGMIVAQMVYEAIKGSAEATGIRAYNLVASVSKWMIIVITGIVVLEQVGIQTAVLQIFAGGLSLMIALAGGLAFGLGGQYHAKELLDEIKNKVRK